MAWMTSRSEATLTARDASTTRCTSSSPISRSPLATATTPIEFCDHRCVTPRETTADSMRCPAIRSAAMAADWMDAIVLSRLTTTPLRRPSDALSPTPMMLTGPLVSSDSAMTTATRLVPRSRPTVRFRRDKSVLKRLLERRGYKGGLPEIIRALGRLRARFCGWPARRDQHLCLELIAWLTGNAYLLMRGNLRFPLIAAWPGCTRPPLRRSQP